MKSIKNTKVTITPYARVEKLSESKIKITNILREELFIYNGKNKLSEESLFLVNNSHYIENVLGIKKGLNENYSLSLRKQIITEQLIFENLLGSINKYIGNVVGKGKEKAMEVVDSIANLKDVAKLFKDLLLDSELMVNAILSIKKLLLETINKIKQDVIKIVALINDKISGFADKFEKLMLHIEKVAISVSTEIGWKGFLMILGFLTLLSYLQETVFGKIISGGLNFIQQNTNIIAGISGVFNTFKELKELALSTFEIGPILTWFTGVVASATKEIFDSALIGFQLINIIGVILTPVIKSVSLSKKLRKT